MSPKFIIIEEDQVCQILYTGKFFHELQDSNPINIFFSPDGLNLYISGDNVNSLFQYSLSIAWDISTTSYTGKSFHDSNVGFQINSASFSPDGMWLYVAGPWNFPASGVRQYLLGTAWDISTVPVVLVVGVNFKSFFFNPGQAHFKNNLFFSPDGLNVYTRLLNNGIVSRFSLSVAWDISTASFVSTFTPVPSSGGATSLFFNISGTQMLVGNGDHIIYKYVLSTPWDITTAINFGIYHNAAAQDTAVTGSFFKNDFTSFFLLGNNTDNIYQYSACGE